MKKVKGVVAAVESSPLYAAVYDDPRTRLRHQSLMQDYEELYEETGAKKKKLHMLQQKRLTLLAEVRFLRRRYKYLRQNQSQNLSLVRNCMQPHDLVTGSKNVRWERKYGGKGAVLRPPVPPFDLNQKRKVQNGRETTLQSPAVFDSNQKPKSCVRKEVVMQISDTIPDLNQKERIYSGKEAIFRNATPIFDLNQISEEELQANVDMMRMEEPKMSSMRGGSDEQRTDMNLSACRNVGNGSSRAGKRKISWQDQVALRV